ncbi:MAG: hypothetical protein AB1696_13790 [Planctomycetota bacterium]
MANRDKRRKREKRRQQARTEKRRKLLAGALREDWTEWPLVGACMTSLEFWQICGQTTICACRESENGSVACAVSQVDLFQGGIVELTVYRGEREADFDDAVREIADETGRRITTIEPEAASRLFWGAYAFGRSIGPEILPAIRTRASFFPHPEGDCDQWSEALHSEWRLIAPRLQELAGEHQAKPVNRADQPAFIVTMLRCHVSDPKRLVEFLHSREPEISGDAVNEGGTLLFDWTGPPPGSVEGDDRPPGGAQRLLAQASLKDDVFTVEARTAVWVAEFYETIARNLRDILAIKHVEWRSFRDILPP